jgi:hypothetical protein
MYCSNCGSKTGPFNKRLVPGKALCGFDPRSEDYLKIVRECNARRAKKDKGNDD